MTAPKAFKVSTGFTLLEISVVVAILLMLVAVAVPNTLQMLHANRVTSEARGLARQLSLARQRAGADFTWARIVIDASSTPNSYTLEICTTKATSSCTTFAAEGGTQYLLSNIKLGFGSSSGAAGGQTTRAQTTTVTFNSRGIPIDSVGSPTTNDTIYLTDDQGYTCAVSVTLSGHVNIWRYNGGWVSL
jgi:prepilin-type N-terminal cleavage/methylation domain-containing protein